MAFVQIPGGFIYPRIPRLETTVPTLTTTVTIADANDKAAYIFQCPKAGTLKGVQFRTSGLSTANNLKVSFPDVSLSDGNPMG